MFFETGQSVWTSDDARELLVAPAMRLAELVRKNSLSLRVGRVAVRAKLGEEVHWPMGQSRRLDKITVLHDERLVVEQHWALGPSEHNRACVPKWCGKAIFDLDARQTGGEFYRAQGICANPRNLQPQLSLLCDDLQAGRHNPFRSETAQQVVSFFDTANHALGYYLPAQAQQRHLLLAA